MAVSKRILKLDPTINAYIKVIIESDAEDLPRYFEKDELALFLNTVKKNGLFMDDAIFTVLSYTGMRVGELVAPKWKDIDFKNQSIYITKTSYNPDNNTVKYKLIPPKTRSSRRKVTVDQLVIDTLEEYQKQQEVLINHFGKAYLNKGYVFGNVNRHPGYPILVKFVESRMARILKKTELNTKLTPHSLRHTHTSLLAEAGVTMDEIMDRLGHHDDEITRKVYLHITEERKSNASEKFSKLMRDLI